MGLFGKKRKLDSPPVLDIPPPMGLEEIPSTDDVFASKAGHHEGELDIPPINSDMGDELKPFPELGEGMDEPESQLFPDMPEIPVPPSDMDMDEEPSAPPKFEPAKHMHGVNDAHNVHDVHDDIHEDLTGLPELNEPMVGSARPMDKSTNKPKYPSRYPEEHHDVPNYDKLLGDLIIPQKPLFHESFLGNGPWFLSMTNYKKVMENVIAGKNKLVVEADTAARLNMLQDECDKKYDKYQSDFDKINKNLMHLEETLFG